MNIVSGLVLYVITWWTVLFAVLPWGVRQLPPGEPGAEHGAPSNPHLLSKVVWTSVISALIWLAMFAVIESNLFSFRAWVSQDPL
jgi:predicted secreted protein